MSEPTVLELDGWVTRREACALTGRSEANLRQLRNAGKLAYAWHAGRVLYRRADLEALGPKSKRGRPRK